MSQGLSKCSFPHSLPHQPAMRYFVKIFSNETEFREKWFYAFLKSITLNTILLLGLLFNNCHFVLHLAKFVSVWHINASFIGWSCLFLGLTWVIGSIEKGGDDSIDFICIVFYRINQIELMVFLDRKEPYCMRDKEFWFSSKVKKEAGLKEHPASHLHVLSSENRKLI